MKAPLRHSLICLAAASLAGCAALEQLGNPSARQVSLHRKQHECFRAQQDWRKLTYRHTELLTRATAENSSVEISLKDQRGFLLVDGSVAMDFPVATGKASHPTPKGSYKIIEKKKDHKSNLYGKIVSAEGQTVVSDADTRANPVPEGGRFVGAPMPYWMRLTTTGVGLHIGYIPGRPASHGCIRLKRDVAVQLFDILDLGSPVIIDHHAPSLGAPAQDEKVATGETPGGRASG